MTWPKVALGEVMTLDLEPHRVEAGQTYPNIGIYSFGRGTFAKADIDAASTSASTLYRVRAGQIIYSRLFAFEGAYASVPAEHDGAFVSNEFPTFTVDPDQVDPDYIAWLFRWHGTWRSLRAGAVGMGDRRQRVHPDRVLHHRIFLPSLAEQRRTIMRLDAAAAAMAARITAAGELEAELAATLAAAFDRITRDAPRSTMGEVAPLARRSITIDPEAEYAEIGVRSFYRGIFTRRVLKGEDFSWQKLFRVNKGDLVFSNLMAWEQAVALGSGPINGLAEGRLG